MTASGADAEHRRECRRILGRHAVDHGEAGFGAGAVARIDAAVDGGREHHAPAFLQADEILAPGRIVRGQVGARDGDQAAAFGEAREGRADMAQGGVGDAPLDMRGGRERRVHQHEAGAKPRVEMIVDVGRIEAGDGHARKQPVEKSGARFGQLVEDERCAGDLGEDGEQAGAGRWLQHKIARRGRGSDGLRRSRA